MSARQTALYFELCNVFDSLGVRFDEAVPVLRSLAQDAENRTIGASITEADRQNLENEIAQLQAKKLSGVVSPMPATIQ